jgi:hypothetical protein
LFALDLSDVPLHCVIITGAAFGPVEDHGGYIRLHIVLVMGGLLNLGER